MRKGYNVKIKTIMQYCKTGEDADAFDERVNAALADGWGMIRRELHTFEQHESDLLHAELFKPDVDEVEGLPVTWRDAVTIMQETCGTAETCDDACPMFDWCQMNLPKHGAPANWSDPQ